MATYAIGDVQGCFERLKALLKKIQFDSHVDRLWFAGDLVNRGPDSLAVVRFIRDLPKAPVIALGNHDLHTLARLLDVRQPSSQDTLETLLNSPERDELIDWLRQQNILYTDSDLGYSIVHAGIVHTWTFTQASAYARELEQVLLSDNLSTFLQTMYANQPSLWDDALEGTTRWRVLTNYFTRMRYTNKAGRLDLGVKTPPGTQPDSFKPWFAWPRPAWPGKLLFGHFAALGEPTGLDEIIALDKGCVWGGKLCALRLEDGRIFEV